MKSIAAAARAEFKRIAGGGDSFGKVDYLFCCGHLCAGCEDASLCLSCRFVCVRELEQRLRKVGRPQALLVCDIVMPGGAQRKEIHFALAWPPSADVRKLRCCLVSCHELDATVWPEMSEAYAWALPAYEDGTL